MRTLVLLTLFVFSTTQAHEGHVDPTPPAAIKDGKLKGKDELVYLDAGPEVNWAGQKLRRQITDSNQVVYQFNDEIKSLSDLATGSDKYLELKIPGAEVLKPFSFDHAGEMHDPIEIVSPDFSTTNFIDKSKALQLRWKADATSSLIKVIIEIYSTDGKLAGRVTISTRDNGEYDVPANFLQQLPAGSGKIAIKRIWFGEFQPQLDSSDMVGVKCVVSALGSVKISGDED